MLGRAFRFIRLPLLLLVIFAVVRLSLGAAGIPYAPRGSAMSSMFVLTLISSFYYGALSRKVGGFGWGGTLLIGYLIGLSSQILIFLATWLSYTANIETSYFRHWDFLDVSAGTIVPMATALWNRLGPLVAGPIITMVPAIIGRALGGLVSYD
jgi:hypothetical protein